MKNGEHGPTPCSRIIQRNRRNALCFKGFVILFKYVAIIDPHDWHRISRKGSASINLLTRWWILRVCFMIPTGVTVPLLYCTFAKCFYLKNKIFTDWIRQNVFICFFNLFLSESSVPAEVVAAVDVNTTANEIYKHNFPTTPLLPKTIEVSLCPLESYLVMQIIRHILFGRIHINTKWLP